MIYENLYVDFKKLFNNESDIFFRIEKENNLDNNDGMHILFGLSVMPFILYLKNNNKDEDLRKCFSFFEEMANSQEHLISEVLEFTIIENILSLDKELADYFKQYMGEKTKESCMKIEKYSI